ncbi:MAG: AAA family ATPase [Gemmatimonadales bacterium]
MTECLRYSKQLAVIIFLATRPGTRASREDLLSLLWSGSLPHDARQALRQVIYQIRHNTDPDFLRGDEMLSLRAEDLEFDVTVFRDQLASNHPEWALSVYDSDFLASVALPGAREFEQWAEGVRQQLAAERRQLLHTMVTRAADRAEWTRAADLARQLVEADPFDLEPRMRLVELLAFAGDAVRARAAADEVRRLAERTHGDRLPATIENGLARALAPTEAPERRLQDGFPRHPEMVGRAAEFGEVVDLWRGALAGRGGAALISGEAGIGKTRLTLELERRFHRDRALVLRTACYAIEQTNPLGPFMEAVRLGAGSPGLGGALPASLEVLAAIVPEIADRFSRTIAPRTGGLTREAIGAAIVDALSALSREATVALIVEDLQWAAAPTIAFAHRLARESGETALLVILTARDYAPHPDTTAALRELADSTAIRHIPLEPLDVAEVEQLISSIAELPPGEAGRELAPRVHRRSGGVPLYVLEVLKTLFDAGEISVREGRWHLGKVTADPAVSLPVPATIHELLLKRIAPLGEAPFSVLTALGVWGREMSVEEIAQVTGLDEQDVQSALQALERRRVVGRPARNTYDASHEELEAAAVAEAPPGLLATLHANAAGLAERYAEQGRTADWSVAARHRAEAGDPERAALNAGRAAAALERTSGREVAREMLARLLEPMPYSVQSQVERVLQPVLSGRRTARAWLDERLGRRRVRRVPALAATVATVLLAGVGIALALSGGSPPAPLGGGYIALAMGPQGDPSGVTALRIDSSFVAHEIANDSLPPGVRHGFPEGTVRPDGRVAAFPCSMPGHDPVLACGFDLVTGDTVLLGSAESDARLLSWLPDASGFVMWSGYLRPGGRFGVRLDLVDSAGRLVRTIAGGPFRYRAAVLDPAGSRVLARRQGTSDEETVLLALDGSEIGRLEWCGRGTATWAPDGERVACPTPSGDAVAIGTVSGGEAPAVVPLPGRMSHIAWSPDGRFLAACVTADSLQVYLFPSDGLGEPRMVFAGPSSVQLLGWTPMRRRPVPARIEIARDTVRLEPGHRWLASVAAWDTGGQPLEPPPTVRWTVSDTAIARVDAAGRVTADRPGKARLIARFGMTGAATATVVVSGALPAPRFSEGFENGIDATMWRPFGNPAPRVIEREGRRGSAGFHSNGDESHTSGVALRRRLDVSRGITVEYWARVPLSGPLWQEVWVGLYGAPADSFHLRPGNPGPSDARVGLLAILPNLDISEDGLWATIILRPGVRATGRRLPDDFDVRRWHRYKLVVYPFGEVRWFANGVELMPPIDTDLGEADGLTLTVGGRSANTLVIVDDVTVWEGVVLDRAGGQ